MSSLTLDDNSATYQIRGYAPGRVQINDEIYQRSVIVAAHTLITDWAPQTLSELTREDIAQAVALKPDILIIGTGSRLEFPALELYGEFINQGIGIEIMDSSAACRTYSALTAENRNIVVALLL